MASTKTYVKTLLPANSKPDGSIPLKRVSTGHLEYNRMRRLVLASGILRRAGGILLVRCRYDGEPEPLWTLPGGRQEVGETLSAALRREFREEASLGVDVGELAYVSESIDLYGQLQVVNCTFWVREQEPALQPRPQDRKVVEARFVPASEAPALLRADVLRIPVAAALRGDPHPRHFSFDPQDITVPFFSAQRRRQADEVR
jgi:8-oxo-dGTP diphosphatase